MNLTLKAQNILRMLMQRYGSESVKRHLWNEEFSSGKWSCLDEGGEEEIHPYVEKYANGGGILDLGCGSGTAGIKVNPTSYSFYTGVDISDVAIQTSIKKAKESGVADRTMYQVSDIWTYVPERQYNVIFFGDSIYYIPPKKIALMLFRYAGYLTAHGVFMARIFDISRKSEFITIIEGNFTVLEKHHNKQTGVCNIVFAPNAVASSSASDDSHN